MKKSLPNTRKNSTKSRSKKSTTVRLAHPTTPLRHFRLAEHAHTGKILHPRHSSHALLILLLLFVGVFLVISQQFNSALANTVTVGAVVNGQPPSVGAVITSPADQSVIYNQTIITITGTCSPTSFVVVKSNDVLVGSTNCTVAGIFTLTTDLPLGRNVLSALNFDNANQAGPVTPSSTVTLIQDRVGAGAPVLPVALPGPTLPGNPSIIPGNPGVTGQECDRYVPDGDSVPGGKLSIAVVCIPRILEKNQQYTLGVIVRGGQPPYALNIDWGSTDKDRLVSITKSGYEKINFRYTTSGSFNITLNLTDSKGATTKVETAVQVNGTNTPLITRITDAISPSNWFTSPIPLYIVAVAVTLGFWGGDIFDRQFGAPKVHHHSRHRRA